MGICLFLKEFVFKNVNCRLEYECGSFVLKIFGQRRMNEYLTRLHHASEIAVAEARWGRWDQRVFAMALLQPAGHRVAVHVRCQLHLLHMSRTAPIYLHLFWFTL